MAQSNENNQTIETRPDKLTIEILSPSNQALSSFMQYGGGLGGGFLRTIPDDPSYVWDRLFWDHPLATYVFRDMEEKDDELGACLDTRKEAVLSKSTEMIAASEKRQDKKIADSVFETMEGYYSGNDGLRFGFSNFKWEALDAIAKGVAIGENIYALANDRVYISEVKFKHQSMFSFAEGDMAPYASYGLSQTGPLRLNPDLTFALTDLDVDPVQPLPRNKFFIHTFRPYQGDRWGTPLDRQVFWLTWIKRQGLKQWLRYLERGAGTIIARYQGAGTQGERELALKAAQAVAEEAAAAISKNFEVESLENVRQSLGSSHKELTDEYCNKAIARRILGQTATRGGEGGWSKGNVQEAVASRKTEVDSLSLMLAVNMQIVFPLTFLNHGAVARPPIWTINYEPQADMGGIIKWLHTLWQMHVPIAVKPIYKTFQLREPAEGEEVLPPPSQSEETAAPAGGEADVSFAEQLAAAAKKKVQPSFAGTRLNNSTSKMQRFSSLRPRTTD
jgi:phage gp29-like protein